MEDEKSLELARLLGDAGEGEIPLLRTLCQAAEEELAARLREGAAPETCGTAFSLAAAWLALASLEGSRGGVERFSAGDLTIQCAHWDRSGWYREHAERVLGRWLRDDGFSFRGVRG